MTPFTILTGIAAPLPMANVDTDMIIPKQFLKTIHRTGLGEFLFHERRQRPDGTEIDSFILNRDPWRKTNILIAGANFGCGSSREHAPWALADFGIRCVIAPSFADIFFNNSAKNGILLVTLGEEEVGTLMADANEPATATMTVNLEAQEIVRSNTETFPFQIEPFRRNCLLQGLDDIGLTLEHEERISTFEADLGERPWLRPQVEVNR